MLVGLLCPTLDIFVSEQETEGHQQVPVGDFRFEKLYRKPLYQVLTIRPSLAGSARERRLEFSANRQEFVCPFRTDLIV